LERFLLYDTFSMLSFIKGKIQYKGENFLEISLGNFAYKVFCSPKTLEAYPMGEEAEIFTHLHVREDLLDLYGFQTRSERDFFELLLGISGIGPKTALGVLAAAPLDLLKKAIAFGDTSVLTRVSGIGQKTAQRIILELRGKLEAEVGVGDESILEGGDVIEALMGLGYTRSQAQRALREVPEHVAGVENKVKEALKILGK
jgi:Holliday junction DNA helicase RuvA